MPGGSDERRCRGGQGDVLRPRSAAQDKSSFAGLGEELLGDLCDVQTIYRSLKIF